MDVGFLWKQWMCFDCLVECGDVECVGIVDEECVVWIVYVVGGWCVWQWQCECVGGFGEGYVLLVELWCVYFDFDQFVCIL